MTTEDPTARHREQLILLADDFTKILKLTSVLVHDYEAGDWRHATTALAQLSRVADRAAREVAAQAEREDTGDDRVTGDEVMQKITRDSRHYRLGKLLGEERR